MQKIIMALLAKCHRFQRKDAERLQRKGAKGEPKGAQEKTVRIGWQNR
jgi:hypothetical protein